MLGDSFLVGVFTEGIYLPAGNWYDYWTGEKQRGGSWISYEPPGDKGGALFVKEGAVIPLWKSANFIREKPVETIEILLFGGETGEFSLKEDDGITYDYLTGQILTTKISFTFQDGTYDVRLSHEGGFQGMPSKRTFLFVFHQKESCTRILVNGLQLTCLEPAAYEYNYQKGNEL
jgi:alpha-glucosidase (family GH31 glycosyl hydrolase)